MAKNYYLPTDDNGKADLLDQFAAKLSKYNASLEISAADLASAQADAAVFSIRDQGAAADANQRAGTLGGPRRQQGFAFLAIDTHPPYPGTAPLPAPGAGAVWKYRAIYRLRDEQVGQWSDVLSVTVGG